MAHELDVIRTGEYAGKKAMFSVGESPWHDHEGTTVIATSPSIEGALARMGANFQIDTVPIYTASLVAGDDGTFQKSKIGRAIIRTDRPDEPLDRVLGLASDRWQPIQIRDAVEATLQPLIDKGVAALETGGILDHGRKIWMLVKFNITDPVVQEVFGGEVVPFGLISVENTGKGGLIIMLTAIRVVCANTLGMALTGWQDRSDCIMVPHVGNARIKAVEASELIFGGITDRYRVIAQQYKHLKESILSVEQFTKSVLDVAAPLPRDLATYDANHLTVRGYDLARSAAVRRREAITVAWDLGKGHVADHSAWEAYNGAVEVIDHDRENYRTRKSRVASLMSGRLLQVKRDVLTSVARETKMDLEAAFVRSR